MSNFNTTKVSNFGQTITGKTPSSTNPEDFGSKYMFVTPTDSFENKLISKTQRYISEVGRKRFTKKMIPPNSVMVTCIGSAMGKVALNKNECLTNQQINSIVVNTEKYNPDYLYYTFLNNYKLLRNAAQGSTSLPNLNKTDFDNLEILVHENVVNQQEIARILSVLDSKIELNSKINNELETMAKTLYNYWFVQFDFPDKNGKPYKLSGGEMTWCEELKRETPKGWEIKKIKDLIEEDKSGDWGKGEESGNYNLEVFCIRGADINGLNGKEQCNPPKRYILQKNDHKLLKANDLIIEISGGSPTQSTGRIAKISETTEKRFRIPIICSNFCKALTLKDQKLSYNFLYHWNRLYDNDVFFGYEGKTSGIKNLLFDSFAKSNYLVIPSKDIKERFFETMERIEEKRQKTLEENQKLAELRDWLLPMLMNGQVTVN